MTHAKPDPQDKEDPTIDRQIGRIVSDISFGDHPKGIEPRVLSKVRRRRRILRSATSAIALCALVVIVATVTHLLDSKRVDSKLAKKPKEGRDVSAELNDLGLAELDPTFLTAPPPVVALGVISDDQFAMLNCLESLGEDIK